MAEDAADRSQQQQRREVNTCLQCKNLKIKCDKVRPHCGPCQRRDVSADRCSWESDSESKSSQQTPGPDTGPVGSAAPVAPLAAAATTPSTPGSAPFGWSDSDARAMLERISALEMRMRGGMPEFDASPAPSPAPSGAPQAANVSRSTSAVPNLGLSASQSRTAIPAGGIAGSASSVRSTPNRPSTVPNPTEVISLIDDDEDDLPAVAVSRAPPGVSPQFPFAAAATRERIEAVVASMPADKIVNLLLDKFRDLDRLVPMGISWRLFRVQLISSRGAITDWRNGHTDELGVDLSFLALLFQMLAASAECRDPKLLMQEGVVAAADDVPEIIEQWHDTARVLLGLTDHLDQPNMNTILALALFAVHPATSRRCGSISTYWQMCLNSARKLGLYALATAKVDADRWSSKPEDADTTVRIGPITAARKDRFEEDVGHKAAEEAELLRHLLSELNATARTPHRDDGSLEAVLPDRSHLVRESARMLWTQLKWHAMMCGDWLAPEGETSRVSITADEAEIADGERFDLPTTSTTAPDGSLSLTTSAFAMHQKVDRLLFIAASLPRDAPPHQVKKTLDELRRALPPLRSGNASKYLQSHDSLLTLTSSYLSIRAGRSFLRTERPIARALVDASRGAISAAQGFTGLSDISTKPLVPWLDAALLQSGLVLVMNALLRVDELTPQDISVVKSEVDCVVALIAPPDMDADEFLRKPAGQQPRSKKRRNGPGLLLQLVALVEERRRAWLRSLPKVKHEDGEEDVEMDVEQPLGGEGGATAAPRLDGKDPIRPYYDTICQIESKATGRQAVDMPGFWGLLEGIM